MPSKSLPRPSISIPPTSVICLAAVSVLPTAPLDLCFRHPLEIYHNSSVPYSRPAPPVCGPGHPSDSGGTDIQSLRWNGLPRRASSYIPYIVKAGIRQMGDVRDHSETLHLCDKIAAGFRQTHAASLPSDPRIPVSPFSVSIAVVGFSPAQLLLPVPGIFS